MYNILLAIMYAMMLITVFVSLPLLAVLRFTIVYRHSMPFKQALLVIFLPFSFGYYCFVKKENQLGLYNKIVFVLTLFAFLGILFTLYQRLI